MYLTDFITRDRILPKMRSTTKKEAMAELAQLMAGNANIEWQKSIEKVLFERERLASTAIGDSIAIPHGKLNVIDRLIIGLGRSRQGLDFESVDGAPTRIFFVLLAPESAIRLHLKALARISRLCKEPLFRTNLLQATDASELLEIIRNEDAQYHDHVQ